MDFKAVFKRMVRLFCIIAVILTAGPLLTSAPVSAANAYWSAEEMPDTEDNVLGPAGIDVRDIAVTADGGVIFAVPGDSISENTVYKSTDTGSSWTESEVEIAADLVAVAPDDGGLAVIANSSTAQVFFTDDGGSNWYDLGIPRQTGSDAAASLYDVAVSRMVKRVHYIAVAGRTGDTANVWYYTAGATVSAWEETNTLDGFDNARRAKAVAFSPDFTSDRTMFTVTESDGGYVRLQVFSFEAERWNDSAGYNEYPVTIVSISGITGLESASLALAPDDVTGDNAPGAVFIGLDVNGDTAAVASSGIYLADNDRVSALKTGVGIHSVAFGGSVLVAGGHDSAAVYRSENPLESDATVSPTVTLKEPGGTGRVVVAWAGAQVVAATAGNESAFAVSWDSGAAFNDISLIDTEVKHVRDIGVSEDGGRVYLVTDDNTDLSLWRRDDGRWERVLGRQGTTDYIVRLAPENEDIVYVARKGGTTIYYNDSGGDGKWATRTCAVSVRDMAAARDNLAYVLSSIGSVSRTNDAGLTWTKPVPTTLSSGATIFCASQDFLLAGSQDGFVAYSGDGNLSWTKLPEVLATGAGKVQVIADEDFGSNKTIYAASDVPGQDIRRWQIGASQSWASILSNISGSVFGLAMDERTLYAVSFDRTSGKSTLWYISSPALASGVSSKWSFTTTTSSTDADNPEVWFNATPRALKASRGKVWAAKTNGVSKLYGFTNVPPEGSLICPEPGHVAYVNKATGVAYDILFGWQRPDKAQAYELQIAFDRRFTHLGATITIATQDEPVMVLVGPGQTGDTWIDFIAGETYYWRVRVTRPGYGAFSEVRSFTVRPLQAVGPALLTPANGSYDTSRKPAFSWEPTSGTSEYQFVLGDNPAITNPFIDTRVSTSAFAVTQELEYGRTYFWRIRASAPVTGGWSAVANFTVKPEQTAPVAAVTSTQAALYVLNVPDPPPSTALVFPPPAPPEPAVPYYVSVALVTVFTLLLGVIFLIIRPIIARPRESLAGYGKGLPNSVKVNLVLRPAAGRRNGKGYRGNADKPW